MMVDLHVELGGYRDFVVPEQVESLPDDPTETVFDGRYTATDLLIDQ